MQALILANYHQVEGGKIQMLECAWGVPGVCQDTLTPWNGVHVAACIPLYGMDTQGGMEWNAEVRV